MKKNKNKERRNIVEMYDSNEFQSLQKFNVFYIPYYEVKVF